MMGNGVYRLHVQMHMCMSAHCDCALISISEAKFLSPTQ